MVGNIPFAAVLIGPYSRVKLWALQLPYNVYFGVVFLTKRRKEEKNASEQCSLVALD